MTPILWMVAAANLVTLALAFHALRRAYRVRRALDQVQARLDALDAAARPLRGGKLPSSPRLARRDTLGECPLSPRSKP